MWVAKSVSVPQQDKLTHLFISAALQQSLSLVKPKYFICTNQFWNTNKEILSRFECIKEILALDDDVESLTSIQTWFEDDVDINGFEPIQVQGQIDTACILYSSGTTGVPKPVQLTHLNCILNSLPNDFSDETLQTAFVEGYWYHNYDMFMTYKFLALGRKIVYVDRSGPEKCLKCFDSCDVNIAFTLPYLICYLSNAQVENYKLDSLKILYSRSSPLHDKTIQEVKQRLPKLKYIMQGYGMTEAGELTSESRGTIGPKSGSVGMASPGITLKVVDLETSKLLGPNQQGEICLKGPVLMKGYINVDPSTYLDEQGFFRTGDIGYYDEDKYFFIVGRLKEIITYDEHKIAPLELETLLQLHPGVREAGVVGKPVPFYGEAPTAFVVKQPGIDVTEDELIDYVASEVAPFMQLRGGVKFIEEMPRNPRGKIVRQRLREMLK